MFEPSSYDRAEAFSDSVIHEMEDIDGTPFEAESRENMKRFLRFIINGLVPIIVQRLRETGREAE